MSYISTLDVYFPSDDEIWGSGGEPRRRYSKGWQSNKVPQKPPGLRLRGMTYDEIKAKCLKEGKLFEDPDFDAVDSILYYDSPTAKRYVWQRPKEILGGKTPEFVLDGASRFDVRQGQLGDCWMLAALCCLSMRPGLMKKVIPDGQSFKDGDYAGIFRFNLWNFGEWVEVIIDDRLPVNAANGLAYMRSSTENEFWTALLEKAYAKLNGSYKAIDGGREMEAMEDFTGGMGEFYKLGPDCPSNLWSIILKADERESLMCCNAESSKAGEADELPSGLISGHSYSITGVKLMNTQALGNLQMVRLRNPWGNEKEWKGDWSDKSPRWNSISESEKQKIGFVLENDGEFWMSFADFIKNFRSLNICNLGPESLTEDEVSRKKKRWETTCFKGRWIRGASAGGDINSPTAWTNPQYGFEVVDVDEGDNKDAGTVIIELIQRDRRKTRAEGYERNLQIGCAIYQLLNPVTAPLDKSFNFRRCAKNPVVSKNRKLFGRHELRPGSYCVVPFTGHANEEGDFILRFFAEKPVTSEELDEPTGIRDLRSEVKPASEDLKKGKEIWQALQKNSTENLEIDVYDLQDVLNAEFMKELKFGGFSSETCRSLVAFEDVDRSGTLGFREFIKLWILLHKWTAAFKKYDKDGNGTFDSFELRQALHDIGYNISNQTFTALVRAYIHKDGKIHLDEFVCGMARMSLRVEVYNEMRHGREDSNALFNLDQFVQTTMYS